MSLAILTPTDKSHSSSLTNADLPTRLESLVPRTQAEDVQSRARAGLRACPYREVRNTTCIFHKGVLLLQGQVSSFYLKQIAQTILKNVEGVRHIVNTIQVRVADQTPIDSRS